MSLWNKHAIFEKNSIILTIGILVVVAIGGLVEIAPLFYLRSTIEKVEGVRPYTPLELAGRAIYVREGCYNCHSQMIRPLRDEVERYGHYSLAAESMYDKPFQWGSKRTGPDLARVGGKYSDAWHVAHLANPRSIVPQSIMPGYAFLAQAEIRPEQVAGHLRTNSLGGVPYTTDQISNALVDLRAQVNPDSPGVQALQARYPGATVRAFGGNPTAAATGTVTEMDALVAYLQVLGTMVDFRTYDARANIR
ncbi:cytochrome-c oxidase, cbb3-type subunit II [Phreatobacter sp.]|uniref:cytochrome-c oxidase, cbb3-type subunit II n=1 Tax=Phreatobacter sp. TaxID=1966341 RepID=UPI0022C3B566|nr:cytochrome-c oxidase, cbb3-type subunit II [Phreatobacter sp.]MCZ8317062.1 cytochrome-c oxidase, cbb3-type subunit II [Phreatobacter sp.]